MSEITIGDAKLKSNGGVLTIQHACDQQSELTFDADGVQELIRFLTSQAHSEFNRREAFRVPLFDSSGVGIRVLHKNALVQGRPTSISMTGVFIAVAPEDQIQTAKGDEVEVTISFEGRIHSHPASIRRIAPDGYGVAFLDAVKGGQVDPPADIAHVVMAMQRQWASRTV
ncbi:MAG: PilZ domain-containing protein [Pirellulaceae bacterium]